MTALHREYLQWSSAAKVEAGNIRRRTEFKRMKKARDKTMAAEIEDLADVEDASTKIKALKKAED